MCVNSNIHVTFAYDVSASFSFTNDIITEIVYYAEFSDLGVRSIVSPCHSDPSTLPSGTLLFISKGVSRPRSYVYGP